MVLPKNLVLAIFRNFPSETTPNKPSVRFIYILSIIIFIGIGCKTQKKADKSPRENSANTSFTDKEKLEFEFLFFEAVKDKMLGNYPQALGKFQQALRINPRSAATHFEIAQLIQQGGKPEAAEQNALFAIRFDPNNIWYKLGLAEIYESLGNYEKMANVLEQIHKQAPDNLQYLLTWAAALSEAGKLNDAMVVLNKAEAITGVSEMIVIEKKNLYLRMRKPEKSIEELQKLISQYPEEGGYYGMLAEIYENMGQQTKALDAYNKLLEIDPQHPNVHFSLAEYYRRQGDKERSFEELRKAFKNPEGQIELKLQVLSSYFELSNQFSELKPQGLLLCKDLSETHPDDPHSYAVYGDFLLREDKKEEALIQYREALKLDKSRYMIWNQILLIENELGNFQAMKDLSNEALEIFPNQPALYLFNGVALMQLKQYEEAISILKAGAANTLDNPALSSQFFSSIGDANNYLKRYEESNSAYEKALLYNSNNTYVLNNYAYYLSIRKENLEKAKEMSNKSNVLEPGNSSFQDTYAWILYQMKDYEGANIWIDKAIESGGIRSSTIMEHKGDIMYRLNRIEDALDFWNRAIELGGDKKELEKKIQLKKTLDEQ